jgi:AraC-like DNA-binding protein
MPAHLTRLERLRVQTTSVDEARAVMGRLYPGAVLVPNQRLPFECELGIVRFGPVSFVTGLWPGGGELEALDFDGRYVLATATEGASRMTLKGGAQLDVIPERQGILVSPGFSGGIRVQPGIRTRTVTIDDSALEDHFSALTSTPSRGRIEFEAAVDLGAGAGAAIQDLVRLMWRELARPEASPLLLSSVRESLFTALLTGPRHSLSHRLDVTPGSAPGYVRRAEEMMAAHAAEPLTLARIAAAVGVPVRSLQIGFRRARGITPMQFLRDRRFDLARKCLLQAEPKTTVFSVAARLGFGASPGRFSVLYRQRFGESPSESLALALARR